MKNTKNPRFYENNVANSSGLSPAKSGFLGFSVFLTMGSTFFCQIRGFFFPGNSGSRHGSPKIRKNRFFWPKSWWPRGCFFAKMRVFRDFRRSKIRQKSEKSTFFSLFSENFSYRVALWGTFLAKNRCFFPEALYFGGQKRKNRLPPILPHFFYRGLKIRTFFDFCVAKKDLKKKSIDYNSIKRFFFEKVPRFIVRYKKIRFFWGL